MNSEGHVGIFNSMAEAQEAGFDIPVELSELTEGQKERMKEDDQPVVRPFDHASTLGKKLDSLKVMECPVCGEVCKVEKHKSGKQRTYQFNCKKCLTAGVEGTSIRQARKGFVE